VDHVYDYGYAYVVSLLSLLMWILVWTYTLVIKPTKIHYRSKPVSISLLLAFMSYNSQHKLSANNKCTHACYNYCSEEKVGLRNTRSIACEVWSLRFQDKPYNSDNLFSLLILFSWCCCWLFTDKITICMELDPGIRIVMHSVLSLKPYVTLCHSQTLIQNWDGNKLIGH
jgi:hypothetical protein